MRQGESEKSVMHHWQYQFTSDLEVLPAHFHSTAGNQLCYHVLNAIGWRGLPASWYIASQSPRKKSGQRFYSFWFSKPSRNSIFLKLMWNFFRTKLAFFFSYFLAKRKMLSSSLLEVISEQWPYRWFLKIALLIYNSYNVWLIKCTVFKFYLNSS